MIICRPPPLLLPASHVIGKCLLSDLHIGSSLTDYSLIKKELEYARIHGYSIAINGDVFDFILPKDLKRYQPNALHKRLQGCNDIVNKSVDWAYEILQPYVHLIEMIGIGNHDNSLTVHHSTDAVLLLVQKLQKLNPFIHYGGYCGFIDNRYKLPTGKTARLVTYYHHGWEKGSSSLASAMTGLERILSSYENVDLVWLGHLHVKVNAPLYRLSCPSSGHHVFQREVRYIRTGAYMDCHKTQSQASLKTHGRQGNYAADQAYRPYGKGGATVTIDFSSRTPSLQVTQ